MTLIKKYATEIIIVIGFYMGVMATFVPWMPLAALMLVLGWVLILFGNTIGTAVRQSKTDLRGSKINNSKASHSCSCGGDHKEE